MTTYVSSAGHGGLDPGAIGSGYREADVVRSINYWFITDMRVAGFVITDATSDSGDANTVLNAQIRKANASGADVAVSFHLNSNAGAPGTGVEVWYYTGSNAGYGMAAAVSQAIANRFGLVNRGTKPTTAFGWLAYTNMPAILIECGFINNADDMAKIIGRERLLADTVIEALTGKKVGALAIQDVSDVWEGKTISGTDRVETGDEARKWLAQMGYMPSYRFVFIYNAMKDADASTATFLALNAGGVPIGVRNDRNGLTEAVRELEAHRGEVVELYQVGGSEALSGKVMNRLKLAAGL